VIDKTRIVLADDHAILREGIRALLEDQPDMIVVGEAADGRRAVELARELSPDIIVMDIGMPLLNGLEATRQIKRDYPQVAVLVLTMHDNEEYVSQILAAGAAGYVLKRAASSELVTAIRAVAAGQSYLSPAVTRLLIEGYIGRQLAAPGVVDPFDTLTAREREVLQLVAEGHTNSQIAKLLSISLKTVKAHRSNLMQKLGLHDRGELIKVAIQRGIIEV
jgi:NarL family two-component system response regulator LiaR